MWPLASPPQSCYPGTTTVISLRFTCERCNVPCNLCAQLRWETIQARDPNMKPHTFFSGLGCFLLAFAITISLILLLLPRYEAAEGHRKKACKRLPVTVVVCNHMEARRNVCRADPCVVLSSARSDGDGEVSLVVQSAVMTPPPTLRLLPRQVKRFCAEASLRKAEGDTPTPCPSLTGSRCRFWPEEGIVQVEGLPVAAYALFVAACCMFCVPCCLLFGVVLCVSSFSDRFSRLNWLGQWRCDTPLLDKGT